MAGKNTQHLKLIEKEVVHFAKIWKNRVTCSQPYKAPKIERTKAQIFTRAKFLLIKFLRV